MFAHCGGQLAHLIRKISAQREFHPFFLTNLERDKIKMIFQNIVCLLYTSDAADE